MHLVQGSSLFEKVTELLKVQSENTCNFPSVFDMILAKVSVAKVETDCQMVEAKAPKEAMPKNMICLCRNNFDNVGGNTWQKAHEEIKKKYEAAGSLSCL